MKDKLLHKAARYGRRQAKRQTGFICTFLMHQPKMPRAVLDLKEK